MSARDDAAAPGHARRSDRHGGAPHVDGSQQSRDPEMIGVCLDVELLTAKASQLRAAVASLELLKTARDMDRGFLRCVTLPNVQELLAQLAHEEEERATQQPALRPPTPTEGGPNAQITPPSKLISEIVNELYDRLEVIEVELEDLHDSKAAHGTRGRSRAGDQDEGDGFDDDDDDEVDADDGDTRQARQQLPARGEKVGEGAAAQNGGRRNAPTDEQLDAAVLHLATTVAVAAHFAKDRFPDNCKRVARVAAQHAWKAVQSLQDIELQRSQLPGRVRKLYLRVARRAVPGGGGGGGGDRFDLGGDDGLEGLDSDGGSDSDVGEGGGAAAAVGPGLPTHVDDGSRAAQGEGRVLRLWRALQAAWDEVHVLRSWVVALDDSWVAQLSQAEQAAVGLPCRGWADLGPARALLRESSSCVELLEQRLSQGHLEIATDPVLARRLQLQLDDVHARCSHAWLQLRKFAADVRAAAATRVERAWQSEQAALHLVLSAAQAEIEEGDDARAPSEGAAAVARALCAALTARTAVATARAWEHAHRMLAAAFAATRVSLTHEQVQKALREARAAQGGVERLQARVLELRHELQLADFTAEQERSAVQHARSAGGDSSDAAAQRLLAVPERSRRGNRGGAAQRPAAAAEADSDCFSPWEVTEDSSDSDASAGEEPPFDEAALLASLRQVMRQRWKMLRKLEVEVRTQTAAVNERANVLQRTRRKVELLESQIGRQRNQVAALRARSTESVLEAQLEVHRRKMEVEREALAAIEQRMERTLARKEREQRLIDRIVDSNERPDGAGGDTPASPPAPPAEQLRDQQKREDVLRSRVAQLRRQRNWWERRWHKAFAVATAAPPAARPQGGEDTVSDDGGEGDGFSTISAIAHGQPPARHGQAALPSVHHAAAGSKPVGRS